MHEHVSLPISNNQTTSPNQGWKYLSFLVCAVLLCQALFLAAEKRIAGQWGFSLDDSWIHATIARNLASGYGYSFNRGEWVSGSTAPLFTILLAIVYRILGDVVWSAKFLGIIFQCATAVIVFRSMQVLAPARRDLGIAAGLIAGIFPILLWASLSGMEVSLYLFLAALGFHQYLRGRLLTATVVWALGIWVRPDGAFLAALGVASSRRGIPKRAVAFLSTVAAYAAFNYLVGHEWLPQSVGAKASFSLALAPRLVRIVREWVEIWGFQPSPVRALPCILTILLLVAGCVATIRRAPLLTLYCLGFPLVWSLFAGSTGIRSRYILYVIVPGALLITSGASALIGRLGPSARRLELAMLVGGVLLWESLGVLPMAEAHAWNVQNINGMHRQLGEMAKRMTRPGDAIAVNDIGAIGYFSDRYIVDLMGLVSPLRSLPEDLSLYKPRLLIIFPNWFPTYTVYDSLHNTVYYLDADSTHKYSALFLVELRNNTVASRSRMCVYIRQRRADPPPQHTWKYWR